jgi:hypothetical protein
MENEVWRGGERSKERKKDKERRGARGSERHGKSPSERLELMQGTRAGEEEREGERSQSQCKNVRKSR